MADCASLRVPLCTEQFGSRAPRACRAAADGSLQWDGARRWGWLSGNPAAEPGQDAGGGGGPWAALPALSGLRAVLLPQGFPDSVSTDYLPYQLWDSVQVRPADCRGGLGWGGGEQRLVAGDRGKRPLRSAFARGRLGCTAESWQFSRSHHRGELV